ncbi:hypothetical protein UPYG_G00054190 [Umbra pygmaea]|uniref:CARD domain-containing protein n=1 Tax=Umbra pygmaea TaxID=75934 RepID=A0ABD0X7W1_UMBPY
MPIADELLQMKVIHDEEYSNISAAEPSQAKMRELYKALKTVKAKSAFYTSLQKNEKILVEELGGSASGETEH